jgi:hypothetical protein
VGAGKGTLLISTMLTFHAHTSCSCKRYGVSIFLVKATKILRKYAMIGQYENSWYEALEKCFKR